jgi:hypothetical protein
LHALNPARIKDESCYVLIGIAGEAKRANLTDEYILRSRP